MIEKHIYAPAQSLVLTFSKHFHATIFHFRKDICGFASGRDTDKFQGLDYTLTQGVPLPKVKGCGWPVCRQPKSVFKKI